MAMELENLSPDQESALIEADARKEWNEAGYDVKAFTMAAYNDLITSGKPLQDLGSC